MPTCATSFTDLLWQSAIGVVPLAIIVAAICRWRPLARPALSEPRRHRQLPNTTMVGHFNSGSIGL